MSTPSKKWILKSSDGETFEVDEAVASESVTIKHMIEDLADEERSVTVPNVTGSVLAKVIEYCKKHVETPSEAKADLNEFDAEFVDVDWDPLIELVLAANFLNIPGLLDITCQAVADEIQDQTPEEVRRIFNIENDFTEEEERQVREENLWAFED